MIKSGQPCVVYGPEMGETEAKGASGCSRARFLTWFVVAQLLAQIGAFAFLYSYVKRLEYEMRTGSRCEECAVGDILEETVPSNINYPDDELEPEISRQKRSGLLLEDNAVSEIFKVGCFSFKLRFRGGKEFSGI